MDTTSLSFEGRGGEEVGRRGHSKDYRPDLHQMIVGLVMDQDGRPLCCELWPGNTADVTTLLPVVDRLRARFSVGRICVVADRGMISAQSIAALEERKLEYVLGVRERSSAEVRSTVIDDQMPFVPLVVPRVSGELTELEAKQVKIGNRRYIVCRNLAEARRDAEQRSAILDRLRAKLVQGDKALVGNSGFRRYLKTVSAKHFAVDETRVAEDARFDGLYVLRTNTKLTPLQVMLRYRDLLRVEQLFRQDLVEEGLFARRRDLFAELSVVFMDTTSLSFEGRGGEELGRRGHSKDYRPDLHQMIVGLVMDQDGRPLCCELWPGNTADVTTLLPVVDRLRARFSVGRICVVADRGMISAQSIAELEERKLEYVLGVRERSSA